MYFFVAAANYYNESLQCDLKAFAKFYRSGN